MLYSKGLEHAFVADCIRGHGHETILIDVGTGGPPQVQPDITRDQVAEVGGIGLEELMDRQDRGECITAFEQGCARAVKEASVGRTNRWCDLAGRWRRH